MVSKAIFLVCVQALFSHSITSQYIGTSEGLPRGPYFNEIPFTASWAAGPCTATPFATAEWATGFTPAASNGGAFPITSASPISITGVSMTSENAYEGPLTVSGAVPFLAAIALEGTLPTAGSGVITYGCGNGNVAMVSEDLNGFGPYGYDYNRGCSGAFY